MNGVLKAGVLGCGHLGRFHAQKYKALEGCELVAVYDVNPEASQRLAQELGCQACKSLDEFLSKVDCLSLASSTNSHFEIFEKCFENKKSVLVEKPVTHSVETGRRALDMESKSSEGFIARVGHIERFNPVLKRAQELKLLDGNFQSLHFERVTPFQLRGADVSVLLDLMIHDIDLCQYVFGEKISLESVSASGFQFFSRGSENLDTVAALGRSERGTQLSFVASRGFGSPRRFVRLVREIRAQMQVVELDFASFEIRTQEASQPNQPQVIPVEKQDALAAEVGAFLSLLQRGQARHGLGLDLKIGNLATLSEAVSNMECAEAMTRRALT